MIFKNFMRLFYIKPSIRDNRINIYTVTKLRQLQWLKEFSLKRDLTQTMSSVLRVRMILRDLSVKWTRSVLVSAVVRRCRRDGVREMLQCFRQTIRRPKRTLLLSATAACKTSQEEDITDTAPQNNITDEELMALTSEMDKVEDLMRTTLYCLQCGKRLAIDKKQPGISYCGCKASSPRPSEDGWEPFLEAEDVIIWRRQYKGPGQYAYKIYGYYKEVSARDFANVQMDTAYRRVWDSAVASLALIEEEVNGLADQALLHWEVLWPRLFANRDYVYLRRHREFSALTKRSPGGQSIIRTLPHDTPGNVAVTSPEERPTVHSRARRRVLEDDAKRRREDAKISRQNKIFVIVSRSCESEKAPETKHAIRVTEYWSQMVVRSVDGDDQPGMEFVLTYYDEPGGGGMPAGVASWAAGRAAPAYLAEMRRAAARHNLYLHSQPHVQESVKQSPNVAPTEHGPRPTQISEQDMESSREGPDLDLEATINEKPSGQPSPEKPSAQTSPEKPSAQASPEEPSAQASPEKKPSAQASPEKPSGPPKTSGEVANVERTEKSIEKNSEQKSENKNDVDDGECAEGAEEDGEKNSSWWSYLYPFYYFV